MSSGETRGLKHVFTAFLTVAAGSSGELEIAVAPAGKRLRLKKTVIHFPAGTEGQLQVQVRYGAMPVIPDTGYVQGDDQTYTFEKEWVYEAGSPIKIYYNNLDSTYSKSVYVAVTVEEE